MNDFARFCYRFIPLNYPHPLLFDLADLLSQSFPVFLFAATELFIYALPPVALLDFHLDFRLVFVLPLVFLFPPVIQLDRMLLF